MNKPFEIGMDTLVTFLTVN